MKQWKETLKKVVKFSLKDTAISIGILAAMTVLSFSFRIFEAIYKQIFAYAPLDYLHRYKNYNTLFSLFQHRIASLIFIDNDLCYQYNIVRMEMVMCQDNMIP